MDVVNDHKVLSLFGSQRGPWHDQFVKDADQCGGLYLNLRDVCVVSSDIDANQFVRSE